MVSNHRCDTIENCAVLQAVYDVSGLDMNDKKHTLSVKTLMEEWEEYVEYKYGTMNIFTGNSLSFSNSMYAYYVE